MKDTGRNYKICTLDRHLDCSRCPIRDNLLCDRSTRKNMYLFWAILIQMILCGLAVLAVAAVYTGWWWTVPFYFIFWLVYMLYSEVFVHCPHCPYWDEGSDTLNCMVNCGVPKPNWKWIKKYLKYDPRPYNTRERVTVWFFNHFSMLFPWGIIAYCTYLTWSISTRAFLIAAGFQLQFIVSMAVFLSLFISNFCSHCPNFCCGMNRVSPEVAREYLRRNPYISAGLRKGNCRKPFMDDNID